MFGRGVGVGGIFWRAERPSRAGEAPGSPVGMVGDAAEAMVFEQARLEGGGVVVAAVRTILL